MEEQQVMADGIVLTIDEFQAYFKKVQNAGIDTTGVDGWLADLEDQYSGSYRLPPIARPDGCK